MNLQGITVVCESNESDEVNAFLGLGWRMLQTSAGFYYEECIQYHKIMQTGYITYSLGWFGNKEEVKYPDSYIRRTAPF